MSRPDPRGTWLIYLFIIAVSATVLTIAAKLTPSPLGHGTHTQLGMPPCSFVVMTGYPCPSCGWTTAFAYMMHAKPLASFRTQPFGALLCLATAFAGMLSLLGLLFRVRVVAWIERWRWPWIAGSGIFMMLASWAYKAVTMRHG